MEKIIINVQDDSSSESSDVDSTMNVQDDSSIEPSDVDFSGVEYLDEEFLD